MAYFVAYFPFDEGPERRYHEKPFAFLWREYGGTQPLTNLRCEEIET
jgi:hypothetical protein